MSEPESQGGSCALKALTIFSVGVLLGFGLCGASSLTQGGTLALLGAFVVVVCALGCLASLAVMLGGAIYQSFKE